MITAQRICLKNSAWVVLSFGATSSSFTTPSSSSLAITRSATIDLAAFAIKEGGIYLPAVAVVGDIRPSPPPAPEPFEFAMNGCTAHYDVTGMTGTWKVSNTGMDGPSGRPVVQGFPAEVPLNLLPYCNWDEEIQVTAVLVCAPRTTDDVVAVCNWAKGAGYLVRPRGVGHGWSPFTVAEQSDPSAKIMLMDLTKSLWQATFSAASDGLPNRVAVGTGAVMLDLLEFLEAQPGGTGAAPGFSFPHVPAPGHLTVGGVLAINGHGTAVPTPPDDDFAAGYGSMSNNLLEVTAVCTDPAGDGTYELMTFARDHPDAPDLLVNLGRALIVSATLQVVDNYNLRCLSRTDLPADTVFAAPNENGSNPADSFGDLLATFGRVEIIWFPFSTNPWVHLWQVAAQKPSTSLVTAGPYNYPFADHVPDALQVFVKQLLAGAQSLTPDFGKLSATVTAFGLDGKGAVGQSGTYPVSRDIWGPSKDTLLYIQDTTLRVTANGYAIHLKQSQIQQAVHDFTDNFTAMLTKYAGNDQYPVNSALEIRVTGLDDPSRVTYPHPVLTPTISALSQDATDQENGWDVAVWFDVLTIPGTANASAFYAELEAWLLTRFTAPAGRVMPEWSKGWAYTTEGAWTSPEFVTHIQQTFTDGRPADATWAGQTGTLAKYDEAGLFWSPFLHQLFAT